MKKPVFTGSGVAIVTPFLPNGQIDFDTFKSLINWHISEGTQALIVMGTTGENPTVNDREFTQIIDTAVKTAAKRIPVVAGTGRNDTAHSIELSIESAKLGADALLVTTPYYNKTTQAGLIAHTNAIADSTNLPVILYNVPGRTAMSYTADTYKALAAHKNINGVKEASGNFNLVLQTQSKCPDDFYLYCGNDDQNVAMIGVGAVGCISVLGNIMPRKNQEICAMALSGKVKEATKELARICDLIDALFIETNPIPVKAAMKLMNLCGGTLRLPLVDMSEKNLQILKAAMTAAHLI